MDGDATRQRRREYERTKLGTAVDRYLQRVSFAEDVVVLHDGSTHLAAVLVVLHADCLDHTADHLDEAAAGLRRAAS